MTRRVPLLRRRSLLTVGLLIAVLSIGIAVQADSPFRLTRWLGLMTAQNSGTSFTINLSSGVYHKVTLTGNVTAITFSNPPTTGYLSTFTIKLLQDGTGGRTVAGWPAAVKWPFGVAPTITSTANKYDIVQCLTDDGGTTYNCVYNQSFQ